MGKSTSKSAPRWHDKQFLDVPFIQNAEGTKILLDDGCAIVEVFFDGIPSMVRSATEGIRMRTWSEVQLKYSDKFIFRDWFLFTVNNSRLVEWIVEESCDFYDADKLIHFCIVTCEELIDVVASFYPNIKVTNHEECCG